MSKKKEWLTVDLITLNGDRIEMKVEENAWDEMYPEFLQTLGSNSVFYVGNWTHCNALYKGFKLDHIAMNKIIGVAH